MPNGWGNAGELSSLTSMPYQNPYRGPYKGEGPLPFLGSNPLMQMAGQALAPEFMEASGRLPLGTGSGRSGMYGRIRDYQMTQLHDQMARNLAQQEQGTWLRGMRGAFSMAGIPWDQPQQEFAGAAVDLLSNFAPIAMSSAPNFLDMLGGRRGSELALAEYAFRGGQHRLDPVTGRAGMSGASIQQLVTDVRTTMYDREPGEALTKDVGLSMGQQGEMFAELQRRGMVQGSRDPFQLTDPNSSLRYSQETQAEYRENIAQSQRTLQQVVERQYDVAGRAVPRTESGALDVAAIRQDPGMMRQIGGDAQMEGVSRELNSRQVISSLENYGGAIKAMREIFGDAGNPNAPMPELINALNALTGGALAQTDPGRVEMMVRTTYALAEATGVGLPGMQVLTQQANAQAQALGLNPAFANVGVQGALAFRQAAQNSGLGGYQAWGRGDIEDFTQMEQTLQLNAAGSAAANRAGAALRLRESMAKPGETTPFAAGSPVETWLAALRTGQRSVTLDLGGADGPETVGTELTDARFRAMMRVSAKQSDLNLSDAAVTSMMSQRQANQRLVYEEGLGPIVRNLQVNDAVRRAAVSGQQTAGIRVRGLDLGLGREAEGRLMAGMSVAVAEALPDIDPATATSPEGLRTHLGGKIREQLQAARDNPDNPMHAEATKILQNFAGREGDFNQWLSGTAEIMAGDIDKGLQGTRYGSLQNFLAMQSTQNLGDAATNAFKATVRAQTDSAMSAFGTGSPARRAVEAMISGPDRGGATIPDVLGAAAGGELPAEVTPELESRLQALREQRDALNATVAEWEGSNVEERQGIIERYEAQIQALEEASEDLAGYMSENTPALFDTKTTDDPTAFLGEANRSDVEKAATALGKTPRELMSMERTQFDKLMDESDAVGGRQAAAVKSARDDIDAKMSASENAEGKAEALRKAIRQTETRAEERGGEMSPDESKRQRQLRDKLEQAEEEATSLSALTQPGGRTPETAGEEGSREMHFKITSLVLNGRDMGSAEGSGEAETENAAGTA